MNIQGNKNVKRLMNEIIDKYESKEAITYMKDDGTKVYYSFSDIFNMVKHWGKCFEKCGLQSGDRVAIVAPHTPKSLILFNGCSETVQCTPVENRYEDVMVASCGIQNTEGYDEVFMFIETQGLSESEIQNAVHLVSENHRKQALYIR